MQQLYILFPHRDRFPILEQNIYFLGTVGYLCSALLVEHERTLGYLIMCHARQSTMDRGTMKDNQFIADFFCLHVYWRS
jgi:hypothetical protein